MFRTSRCYFHGPATRSQSVLTALLRIRQQYQRPLQSQNRRDASVQILSSPMDYTSSLLQERQQLVVEAMKLLRKEMRSSEDLSDVDATSTAFCIEVGKLLSVGVVFGASTSTPRIADALQWVRVNKNHLVSTRQVMSICMPLLNLKDGRTTGRRFVMGELFTPLLTVLEAPLINVASTESELKQHRSAIISVFTLIGRLMEDGGGDSEEVKREEGDHALTALPQEDPAWRERIVRLLDAGVNAILSCSNQSLPPIGVTDCVHILQAFQRLESDSHINKTSTSANDNDDVSRSVTDGLTRVRPLIDAALGPSAAGTTKRPTDVCHLIAVSSKLEEKKHMMELSRAALLLLPPSLASAAAKDICVALQLLVRLRNSAPSVAEKVIIRRFIDAARPRLFMITETHLGTLRHIESSVLMANLSRLDVEVPEDLVNLLCGCFTSHMELALPAQLIPFLQGLCRWRDAVSRSEHTSDFTPVWERPSTPAMLPCLEQATDRVIRWGADGTLTTVEAAQFLLLLSQLQCTRVVSVYMALEPKLVTDVRRLSAVDGVDKTDKHTENRENMECEQETPTSVASLTSILMNAFDAFRSETVAITLEEKDALQRAGELHAALRRNVINSITDIKEPKSLVMVLHLFTSGETVATAAKRTLFAKEEEEKGDHGAEEEGMYPKGDGTTTSTAGINVTKSDGCPSSYLLDAAGEQVSLIASLANAYEVGALAKCMGDLLSKGLIGRASACKAMETLLQRHEGLELTFYDIQSLLDGIIKTKMVSIPSSFLNRITALLQMSPNRTTWMLRRLLPCLKKALLRQTEMEALSKLTRVAMENASHLVTTNTLASLPLRDIALLAYVLGELYGILVELQADNFIESETVLGEEHLMNSHRSHDNETDENYGDVEEDNNGGMSIQIEFLACTNTTFMALGDAVCLCLQEKGKDSLDGTGVVHQISPQEIVILVRSFEKVGVRHHALLYEILPLVRDVSAVMEPLELSLLLNAFGRLGVWNGRILNTLASNVSEQVRRCTLKQCQTILQALQSSQFLRSNTFFSTLSYKEGVRQDWHYEMSHDRHTVMNPLVLLASTVVERMSAIVETSESVHALLESHCLEDLVSVVRVLGFFDRPPEPVFDTYFASSVKKLVSTGLALTSDASPSVYRKQFIAAVALAGYVCKVSRYDRQRVSAEAIVRSLAASDISASSLHREGLLLMPEEKVAELYYSRCIFAMLYGVSFSTEEALSYLQVISKKILEEDVARNPRRIGVVLRLLTRISSLYIGNAGCVSDIVLNATEAIFLRMQGERERSHNDEKPSRGISLYSAATGLALMESLCVSSLALSGSTRKQKEGPLLSYFVEHLVTLKGSQLTAAEGCMVLLAVAVAAAKYHHMVDASLTENVQRVILIHEKQLSVHDAVNLLIVGALSHNVLPLQEETIPCATRILSSQLGKTDHTGLWLLPELYRLVTAGDACVLRWCLQLPTDADVRLLLLERVPPALLRAHRTAAKNIAPTLSFCCRRDVCERYEQCVTARQGGTESEGALLQEEEMAVLEELARE